MLIFARLWLLEGELDYSLELQRGAELLTLEYGLVAS